ncbi:metal ABC transporter ATP-binding protein [Paenibacillus oceani]|uniref:ABC transporter ATP-binding protein n=1 Tax=Paenibacillus oceani TaxID=2772510 RepID=A0A927CD73_9BACL|nr:ABC transporter ATP-binding protein [Paenibacillus oceani]MBD2864442.1 ABC transporter ATP-binding protein [Paenibacillus oceani]
MQQSTRPAGERCHLPVVSMENVSFQYEQRNVIEELNFQILQRDFVGLIGSNGAGKTTLLRMIVGLLKPDRGEVRLFGTPLGQFHDWERIGYVPQKNAFNPLFPATVREVVLSGLYGRKKLFKRMNRDDYKKCEDAMHALRIEELADRRIGRLSGGQQQRVFLARALVNNPELLILDEPTVGIDSESQENFFHMIRHMHQRHNITFLMVSHDIEMMHAYLGYEPAHTSGKIKFFVKHTHELDNCAETNLAHSLRGIRLAEESLEAVNRGE